MISIYKTKIEWHDIVFSLQLDCPQATSLPYDSCANMTYYIYQIKHKEGWLRTA